MDSTLRKLCNSFSIVHKYLNYCAVYIFYETDHTKTKIRKFPEVVVKGYDYAYLQTLFDSIILKDVVKRYNVRYTDDLYNLATYLILSFSNEVSYTKLKLSLIHI